MSDLVEATIGVEVEMAEYLSFESQRGLIAEELGIDPEHIASVEAVD
jgi:hypothetical protein